MAVRLVNNKGYWEILEVKGGGSVSPREGRVHIKELAPSDGRDYRREWDCSVHNIY